MFDSLRDLLTALESNDRSGIQAGLGNLDLATAQISDAQGTIGALANRLQVTHDALDTATLTITKSISDNQDADLATAITQLRLQEVAVQAASQTFTKIFDSSLDQLSPLIDAQVHLHRNRYTHVPYPHAKEGMYAGLNTTSGRGRDRSVPMSALWCSASKADRSDSESKHRPMCKCIEMKCMRGFRTRIASQRGPELFLWKPFVNYPIKPGVEEV